MDVQFIPDPDLDFFYPSRIPDPGVKKAPDPGSGSTILIYEDWYWYCTT
jgi:hypothetical protein